MYDVNPWITVRFGTSSNRRIPFIFQNTHHPNHVQEEKGVDKTRNMEHPGTSNNYNNYEKNM